MPLAGTEACRYITRMAFQPFDPAKPVEATHRNLPHWQQTGATYFVTFRLADSLPATALARLAELRRLNAPNTFASLDHYLDAGTGSCLFAQPAHSAQIESALRHFDRERYTLGAFAIMPNHVHALVQPHTHHTHTLTQILHSWKSYTARQLQRSAAVSGRVWQEESFDRLLRDETELQRIQTYILANPSTANLSPGTFITGHGSFTP